VDLHLNNTMDFSLNDHQKLIRDTVRQFMENEVRPSVRQRDREGRYPPLKSKARRTRLLRHACARGVGGPGLDTVSYVLMLEEVARVDTAMATSLSVTNSAVQAPLLAFGSDAQKKGICIDWRAENSRFLLPHRAASRL